MEIAADVASQNEARAAGLVLAGFGGSSAADVPLPGLVGLAGVILFARNLVSADQCARLVADLRAAAAARGAAPPIVAIDQEGGSVSRLGDIGTEMPSAMALGAAHDDDLVRRTYAAIGAELAALGITLDLAPVADVNTCAENPVIGTRAFGDDPTRVAASVSAAIAGLHDAGVGAVAKHFPGHGDTSVDSHKALPVLDHDLARLRSVELEPFRAAIAAGVDAIMSAHVALPRIDPSAEAATFSRTLLTGVLRDELGFSGVICTDCLEMGAVASQYDAGTAAVRAVQAGADLVCFSTLDAGRKAIVALARALDDGRLDPTAVDRSLTRIAALRKTAAPERFHPNGATRHPEIARAAARASVTIVRDRNRIIPVALRPGQKIFVVQFQALAADRGSSAKQSTYFGTLLARRTPARVIEQIRSLEPVGHEYKQLLMAAGSADLIIAVTRRAWAHPLQARAVGDLALAGKPLVVVAAAEPYDERVAPPDAAVVVTYGGVDASMEAAVDVLAGARA